MSASNCDNIGTYDSPSDSANHTLLSGLISDRVRDILDATFQVVICGIMSVIGSVANIINIIVFCKQGFRDTINISLLGMAIADLGALVFFVLASILRMPAFKGSKIFLGTCDIYALVAIWPHALFKIISSWITVFINFERVLCIAQPLQVKTIITKKRAMFVIVAIFGAIFACMLPPLFYIFRIGPGSVNQYNRTLIIVTYQAENGNDIKNGLIYFIQYIQLSAFVIVIISPVILIRSLAQKSKWRRETASVSRDAMSGRDKSIAKLVISISCIYIFCYFPSVVNRILIICFSPHYEITGRYKNLYKAVWAVLNFVESINKSTNIIIYFKMSSKYRAVLTSMFCPTYKQTTR